VTHRPTQDRDLRIAQQVQDLAGMQVSDVLGADHDDRTGWADQPQQLLVQIGHAWWQVHQQQEPSRHDPDAEALDRFQPHRPG
jgi:hypothetical protein